MSVRKLPLPAAESSGRDYGGLDHMSGFLISMAQAYVFDLFHQDLARHGLSPGRISALIVIYENPGIRHGELADMLLIKPAQMSKMIKAFAEQGWVERRRPREDERVVELFLTTAGRGYVEKNRPILMHNDANRPSGLTAREHQQLVRLLRKYLRMKNEKALKEKKRVEPCQG